MAVYQALLLNTVVPQIQAAQAGDSYVMVVNATTPALRITQTGTGNALEVEDSANPDATPFVVSAAGDVGIGTNAPAYKLDVQGGLARSQNSGGINNGYLITTNSSNAAARNWAVLSNSNAFGDFVIRQGNSLGSDPVSGTDRLVIDASGNLGLGVTPSGWTRPAIQGGATSTVFYYAATNVNVVAANSFFNGVNRYIQTGYATQYSQSSGAHAWLIAPSWNGTGSDEISFTQAMTLDASGNLLVGTTSATAGAVFKVTGATANSISHQVWTTASSTDAAYWTEGSGTVNGVATGSNAAAAMIRVNKDSGTTRSINAAGSLNASGADYAEYMTKAGNFKIAKGDICGIDENGKLTNVFAKAISFVVKSTDPAYVGGDTWFVEAVPLDEAELPAFKERMELARQMVDRIAFAGQVPVNVIGATAGQYIVPVNDNGAIKGIAVNSPTFEQYQIALGKVIAIESDGRARIIVKVV
jgi:hypothetical protein